ncbi:hypothetical protein BGZ75_007864 [Mortierella antarctica]|nr:hypothetical protein BGZ75_007864 [Mortierella antarctica]
MLHHTLLHARTIPVALARTTSAFVIRPAASQQWQRLQQLQWPRQSIHSSGSLQLPRKPRNVHGGGGIRDRQYFGNYTRLAPTSLRLGVVPPDVDSLIPSHIQRPSYALRGEPSEWSAGIPVNDSLAIEKCRKAGQLAKKILELGGTLVKPGVNTDEIDRILREAIIANSAYPSPLNYMGFPKSVCTSISNVIAHGIPDNRALEDGDIINIDITVFLDGYHGDTSATFLVGNVDQAGRELVERTKESLDAAIAICGPGVPLNRIGKTIQAIADRYGYSVSEQFSGHGIGKEFHCLPLIYHHDNDEEGVMEKGMIFTIEPMFCQGTAVGVQWPDKWTVTTADGGRSAQFEHTVNLTMVTENGALTTGRLLVATLLLPETISFQVPPREKDGRFRSPHHSSTCIAPQRLPPVAVSAPPPTSLYSPALDALHRSNAVPETRSTRAPPPRELNLSPSSILVPPAPTSPGHFRSASGIESINSKPISSKADRLKDQERPMQQRASTPVPSILTQPPGPQTESLSSLFPKVEPRPMLNQPRSRTSRIEDLHHHQHHFHPSAINTRMPSSPTSAASSSSQTQNQSSCQGTTFLDSAKVFADAKWTVEKAYGGNIGLQNAVNSIQGQLSKRIWVGTLGMATDTLTDRTRGDIRAELALNHSSIPVFVNDHDFEGHYHQFCKQVLWPIFHYVLPDNLRSKGYEDGSWKHYVAVNRAFADTIVDNYMQGDTIWVNDYHLMLVPNMIRERLPDASIGFFLHIPFPSSEIFRCLHVESNPKGIQLENTAVNVGIFPIGIDTKSLNVKRQDPEVAKWVEVLKEKYAGLKLIVARDKLDYIKGVRQKMLAFERFLNLYPEYQGKIVLIQVALSTSEQNEVQGQVSDVVTRINSKFSDLSYQPIVFLRQDITFSQYLGLLTVADLCLITSLRDGMNLTSHEYVVCQEEQKNPLVLSEFAGTYGSLGACLRVNPWNYTEVATAIHDALEMKDDEKAVRWNELRKHVCTNTAQFWAQGFVSELIKVHGDVQRRYSIHIPLLDMAAVLPQYQAAKRRLLLLDYDGTLLPYERSSGMRSKGKTSSEEMIKVVTNLAQDSKNIVYIMSGRTRDSLESTFGAIPNIGLCAEGGCFLKHAGKSAWENQVQQGSDMQWRKKVMEMFEYYKERTPGSEIEEKSVPLVWHYRQADNPSYGLWQARECQNHIEEAIGSIYPVHAIVGRKCLEVMPRDVSKACAAKTIIESLLPAKAIHALCSPPASGPDVEPSALPASDLLESAALLPLSVEDTVDFVLCVGDDRSDEDMFQFVNGLQVGDGHPHRVVTCTVGSKSSEARWFVPGVSSVLQGLQLMVESALAPASAEEEAATVSTAVE